MQRSILLVILSAILIIPACNQRKTLPSETKQLGIDQLFTSFIFSSDTVQLNRFESLLRDSIGNYLTPKFKSAEFLDTISGILEVSFDFSDTDDEYSIRKRNVFIIYLSRNNQLIAEGDSIKSINLINNQLAEFILNRDNKYWLPEKEIVVFNDGDTLLRSKHGIIINTAMLTDSLGRSSSWFELRSIIRNSIAVYGQVRNEYAIENYDTAFHELGITNKMKVAKVLPVVIVAFLDRDFYPKPPRPPEPSFDEVFEMESEKELLKSLEEIVFD